MHSTERLILAMPEPTLQGDKPPVVMSIHGIRTRGSWQKELTQTLNSAGFIHVPLDYGFFSAMRLIWPPSRRKQVYWFRDKYTDCVQQTGCERPAIIAHSLGSYLVAKSLEMFPQMVMGSVILCGSIVRADYPWSEIILTRKQVDRVLNDYGKRDAWASVVAWGVSDAGNSGTVGFRDSGEGNVVQRKNVYFGHSDYFYVLNYNKTWIPFLNGAIPQKLGTDATRKWNWRFALSLLLLLISLLTLAGYFIFDLDRDLMAPGRPSVGFMVRNIPDRERTDIGLPEIEGAEVFQILKGAYFDRKGILIGDIITKMNGELVSNASSFRTKVLALRVGQSATLELWRPSGPIEMSAKVVNQLHAMERWCNKKNDQYACWNLGGLFQHGTGVPLNVSLGVELYKRACDHKFGLACTDLARVYIDQKQYNEGAAKLTEGCDLGDFEGCSDLADLYYTGSGVGKDVKKSLDLKEFGCREGDEFACYQLGSAYATGIDFPKDDGRAIKYFQKACQWDDPRACSELASRYPNNSDVHKYQQKMFAGYRLRCDTGDAGSCHNVAVSYLNGLGVSRDAPAALIYLNKGCESNIAADCDLMGLMYYSGQGIPKDEKRGVAAYTKACDLKYWDSCASVGFVIQEENPLDITKAVGYYKSACDNGSKYGCSNLASALLQGKGIEKDEVKAAALFYEACQAKVWHACSALATMYSDGRGQLAKDDARAVGLLKISCDNGDSPACEVLAIRYKDGQGVEKDLGKAIPLFKLACDSGISEGCVNYQALRN